MTTPAQEKLRPSPPYRYAELSAEHLDKAAAALAKDNVDQASDEIWGAAASALKAVCQERGWNHRFHNHLRAAAVYLALEWNRPDLDLEFAYIDNLQNPGCEHQWYVGEVQRRLEVAKSYCREILRMRGAEPPSQEHLTPEIIRELNSFRRTLTCPLPDRVAFGAELSGPELDALPPVKPPHIPEVNGQ